MTKYQLTPQPRTLHYDADQPFALRRQAPLTIIIARASDYDHARQLQTILAQHAIDSTVSMFTRDDGVCIALQPVDDYPVQGYRLEITPDKISLAYSHQQGLFYGIMTLRQIIQQSDHQLRCLQITDYPDFEQRGVMLDVSRDRVPTMPTLLRLVDDLAHLKINQLQLYIEHTFAYPQHETVWRQASPFTSEDLLILKQYCRERFIDLVPNQNSLGHMERWLKHDAYRHLAESPAGFEDWAGMWRNPSTLNPTDPAAFEFITALYDVLLPHFDSPFFNVGCDEPWELGRGKSRAVAEQVGVGRVYLDWLHKLQTYVHQSERTMMFWGDIITNHPELIAELPPETIVLEWGYEATHPFAERCQRYASAGIPFYVCPGTSSWNALVGRVDNARGNLQQAAQQGLAYGASGYLITDWGDNGHWQPLVASYAGIVYGAGVAWCHDTNHAMNLDDALSINLYRDTRQQMGPITSTIGNVYKQLPPEHINGQILAYALGWRQADLQAHIEQVAEWGGAPPDLRPANLRDVSRQLSELHAQLAHVHLDRDDASVIMREWSHAIDLLQHGARWLLLMQGDSDVSVHALQTHLTELMMTQRDLWLARSRRGGLADSMKRFELLQEEYQKIASET
jgi:hexosaminidase